VTIEAPPADGARLARAREQKARQAIERSRRDFEANPGAAPACNELAWAYLMAPEPLRDAKAAVPLAEKAVRLAPENPNYRNTLGVAYHRASRYREAIEALRPNLEHQEDWALPSDLYFLAMSAHRLGETARARDYYDWAVRQHDASVRWAQAQPDFNRAFLEELAAFRAEAEELLGIPRKHD
jgi:tetratricopeptide (TPR) repeat protein